MKRSLIFLIALVFLSACSEHIGTPVEDAAIEASSLDNFEGESEEATSPEEEASEDSQEPEPPAPPEPSPEPQPPQPDPRPQPEPDPKPEPTPNPPPAPEPEPEPMPPSGGGGNSGNQSDCGMMNAMACEGFDEVNREREKQGLSPLEISDNCVDAAQFHAEDMDANNYFSHNGLNETWSERFTRFGVTGARAENIARSSGTPARVVTLWMGSTGHRRNILNSSYRYAGMGYSNGYWVQCFTSRP